MTGTGGRRGRSSAPAAATGAPTAPHPAKPRRKADKWPSGDVEKLVGGLQLPGRGAAARWVHPIQPTEQGRKQLLTLGLTEGEVEALAEALAEANAAFLIRWYQWPTAGQDRQVLMAVEELSASLARVLRDASPRADAELATALLQFGRPVTLARELVESLQAVALAVRLRMLQKPLDQDQKPPARADYVEIVDRLLSHHVKRHGLRKLVAAVFQFAGRLSSADSDPQRDPLDPRRAIDAWKRQRKAHGSLPPA